jgi:ribonuclease P protein component
LIVPKRLAKRAVDRSRVRRLIRETFRLNQQRWDGYDCVVRLAMAFAAAADYTNDLNDLWKNPKR